MAEKITCPNCKASLEKETGDLYNSPNMVDIDSLKETIETQKAEIERLNTELSSFKSNNDKKDDNSNNEEESLFDKFFK